MNNENKKTVGEFVRDFRLPRYSEIPNVGLYLEQTTKYVNGYLAPLHCGEITPSMLSNYVKKGIIPNPIKKQYFAEHIAYLFFVAIAKQVVSMEAIGGLVEMQHRSYTLPVAYNYLCEETENMVQHVFGLKAELEEVGKEVSNEKTLLRSLIFAAAHVLHVQACFRLADLGSAERAAE